MLSVVRSGKDRSWPVVFRQVPGGGSLAGPPPMMQEADRAGALRLERHPRARASRRLVPALSRWGWHLVHLYPRTCRASSSSLLVFLRASAAAHRCPARSPFTTGEIFPGLRPPEQRRGAALRRTEQGEPRGRARGVVCTACLPPSWSYSALTASFSRSGGNFCQWRGERGDGCGRGTARTHAMMRQRGQGAGVLPATCEGIVSGRKKSPLPTTAGRGADRRERGGCTGSARCRGESQIQNATAHGRLPDVRALYAGMLWSHSQL